MNAPGVKPLHTVYSSAYNSAIEQKSPLHQKLYDAPHLALFINGDWLPILPGMIIGLVTDRKRVDGIAPYRLMKVRTKTGKEQIDLAAYSTNPNNARILKLGARYSGSYASGVEDADQAVDAAMAAVTGKVEEDGT